MVRQGWLGVLLLPLLVLSPSVVLTLLATRQPELFEALRRDPQALAAGQLWRLLSPVLVQADALSAGGWWRTIAVWLLSLGILAIAERALGVRRTLALYGLGALLGHGIGHLWQPYGSGCSVAGCAVLGALAVRLLRGEAVQPKFAAVLVLVVGLVATLLADIHGPPLLAGAAVGVWWAQPSAA